MLLFYLGIISKRLTATDFSMSTLSSFLQLNFLTRRSFAPSVSFEKSNGTPDQIVGELHLPEDREKSQKSQNRDGHV